MVRLLLQKETCIFHKKRPTKILEKPTKTHLKPKERPLKEVSMRSSVPAQKDRSRLPKNYSTWKTKTEWSDKNRTPSMES